MSIKEKKAGTSAFLSGKLAPVDINKIERELQMLWKSATDPDSKIDGVSSVVRAGAMNLIMYCEDNDAETVASDLLDEITLRHPCRALLTILRAGGTCNLEAWVSARCHMLDPKKKIQVCCEQITVRAEGIGYDALASVVLPLLISDLPVILWWQADSFTLAKLAPFLSPLNQLIVDSMLASDFGSLFHELKQLMQDDRQGFHRRLLKISDLSWSKLLPWRQCLALSFDQKPGKMPIASLSEIEHMEINYADAGSQNRRAHHQALLLAAWFSERLGWQPQVFLSDSQSPLTLHFQNKKSIILQAVNRADLKIGKIAAVNLCFGSEAKRQLSAERLSGSNEIVVHINEGTQNAGSSTHFSINDPSKPDLIAAELDNMESDRSFIRTIDQILAVWQCRENN